VSAVTLERNAVDRPERGIRRRPRRRWTRFLLPGYTAAFILYLCFPIFVIILFSFNDTDTGFGTQPRVKTTWFGFTTVWYQRLFDIPDLTTALMDSLLIAFLSSLAAAAIGALLGLALARYRYRGKGATNLVIFLAISSPEVVLGAALASFFVSLSLPRGLGTVFVSHVMFSIPFVAVTVRARAANLDRSLEDAAMDLGANPVVTFLKVTLPLIFPGILAGWLLAFALSMDDFVITQFVSGPATMFPTWVFGATRVGIPPHVFVFATLIFVAGLVLAGIQALVSHRRPA
jgi:spermidine/putrescine transport system permease protein